MTLIGAADTAQMHLDATELAYHFLDGPYPSTDRRELGEQGGLAGITCEYRRTVTANKWGEIGYVKCWYRGIWVGSTEYPFTDALSTGLGLDQLDGGSEPGNQPFSVLSPGSCWCSGTSTSQAGSSSACSCLRHPDYCPLPLRKRGNSTSGFCIISGSGHEPSTLTTHFREQPDCDANGSIFGLLLSYQRLKSLLGASYPMISDLIPAP